jgi:hypothetical protein
MRFFLLLTLLLSTSAMAQQNGRVICAQVGPNHGFELVKFNIKDKDYSGTYDLKDLRVIGSYNPTDQQLKFEAFQLNEDGEPTKSILYSESRLLKGDYLRIRIAGERPLELYCNAVY